MPGRALCGNLLALLALALIAGALGSLQDWHWDDPGHQRWLLAGASVLAWLLLCAVLHGIRRLRTLAAERASRALLNGSGSPWLVAWASQTGLAEQLAWRTAESLQAAGLPVRLLPVSELDAELLAGCEQALFVVSTTGDGDAPDHAAGFLRRLLARDQPLPRLRYGLLALGDSSYDRFCAFGHRLDAWLQHQHATPLFDIIEVDNGDEATLRHWQHQLGVLGGHPGGDGGVAAEHELTDWRAPGYGRWRLAERRLLNPGSLGNGAWHIALEPLDTAPDAAAGGAATVWQAGDIAEICPGPASAADQLPTREYSIASLPSDGRLELLVRQTLLPDGQPGLGSGWLTARAGVGGEIALRIRENRGFHAPDDDRPLILIGNGTGLAGLRAHLKARIAAGHQRNWLLFGERQAGCDFFHREDIEGWLRDGQLQRLDLAFSRDAAPAYVQDRLREAGDELRRWVDDGAAIYVCGSLQGMAPAVHATLIDLLGADTVETLAEQRRYRRDVY